MRPLDLERQILDDAFESNLRLFGLEALPNMKFTHCASVVRRVGLVVEGHPRCGEGGVGELVLASVLADTAGLADALGERNLGRPRGVRLQILAERHALEVASGRARAPSNEGSGGQLQTRSRHLAAQQKRQIVLLPRVPHNDRQPLQQMGKSKRESPLSLHRSAFHAAENDN